MNFFLTRAGFQQAQVRTDGALFNASAVAYTLFPGCLHAAVSTTNTRLARLTHMAIRAAGLACAYLIMPLAFAESVLGPHPGMCIIAARKPAG